MDVNPIDIKIREFALYLKEFGLLNETNLNDFLKQFKNTSENSFVSSGIFETDVNVGLIYLKENLSKAMLEFFNLMTEERKKITYLNIYSKFLKKREEELSKKGKTIYNMYSSLCIKKYFVNWKKGNSRKNTKIENIKTNDNNNNNNENKIKISIKDYTTDNFCFDIISNLDNEANHNVVINSNNKKIIFNTNNSNKLINSTSTNSNNNNINTFLLSSKIRFTDKIPYQKKNNIPNMHNLNNIHTPNQTIKNPSILFKNENNDNYNYNDNKINNFRPQAIKENLLDKLIFPLNNSKDFKKINNHNFPKNNNNLNKSNSNSVRHSVDPSKRPNTNNIRNNNRNNNDKNKDNNIFVNEEKQIPKQRNTYNHSRPKSSLYYNENTKIPVYQRLYDQNKEKMKRQEERVKENINEIKERANHPIQKKKSYKILKKNNSGSNISNYKGRSANKDNNVSYSNRFRITYDGEKPKFFDKQYVSKKIDEALSDKYNINNNKAKTRYNNYNNYNNEVKNTDDDNVNNEKKNDGRNFMENQRKCIEQFNDMIEKEEKRSGKFFNENDKENIFKDLLNKLYKENQKNKLINNFSNLNEDEKICDGNTNYNNNICESVEIKLK